MPVVGDTVQTTDQKLAGFLDKIVAGVEGLCSVNLQGFKSVFSAKMTKLVLASPVLDAQIRAYATQTIPDPPDPPPA